MAHFYLKKLWGSISPLVYVVKSKCWHCLIQIFIRKKSSIDDLSLFLQLLGPVPKNQLGGGHICLTVFGGYQKNKIWIWKSTWFGTICHKNVKKVAVNFHTAIYYPISSFLNFTPFCWGATFLKKLLPVCYTRWAIRKTNPFVNRSINGNEINFGRFWPPQLWGALAPLIYVIAYYCWTCSMKIFNCNILSIYDFSFPWHICGPHPPPPK